MIGFCTLNKLKNRNLQVEAYSVVVTKMGHDDIIAASFRGTNQ
jgi:hypothetical protein